MNDSSSPSYHHSLPVTATQGASAGDHFRGNRDTPIVQRIVRIKSLCAFISTAISLAHATACSVRSIVGRTSSVVSKIRCMCECNALAESLMSFTERDTSGRKVSNELGKTSTRVCSVSSAGNAGKFSLSVGGVPTSLTSVDSFRISVSGKLFRHSPESLVPFSMSLSFCPIGTSIVLGIPFISPPLLRTRSLHVLPIFLTLPLTIAAQPLLAIFVRTPNHSCAPRCSPASADSVADKSQGSSSPSSALRLTHLCSSLPKPSPS